MIVELTSSALSKGNEATAIFERVFFFWLPDFFMSTESGSLDTVSGQNEKH